MGRAVVVALALAVTACGDGAGTVEDQVVGRLAPYGERIDRAKCLELRREPKGQYSCVVTAEGDFRGGTACEVTTGDGRIREFRCR